jgi:hypothetical protein
VASSKSKNLLSQNPIKEKKNKGHRKFPAAFLGFHRNLSVSIENQTKKV